MGMHRHLVALLEINFDDAHLYVFEKDFCLLWRCLKKIDGVGTVREKYGRALPATRSYDYFEKAKNYAEGA